MEKSQEARVPMSRRGLTCFLVAWLLVLLGFVWLGLVRPGLADRKFAQVQVGMTKGDVQRVMGPPTATSTTIRSRLPFDVEDSRPRYEPASRDPDWVYAHASLVWEWDERTGVAFDEKGCVLVKWRFLWENHGPMGHR
jgi:hypothetical protein